MSKDPIYDPEDPDRVEFLKENVLAIVQQKDEEIIRQKRAITKLEEQNAGLRAKKSWTALVREFHETFNLPIRGRTLFFEPNEVILRAELVREETIELFRSLGYDFDPDFLKDIIESGRVAEISPVDLADAIGDSVYVLIGMALTFGINLDPIFREIHASNMSKTDDEGNPIYREDGKILKGPNFFLPEIEKHLSFRKYEEVE